MKKQDENSIDTRLPQEYATAGANTADTADDAAQFENVKSARDITDCEGIKNAAAPKHKATAINDIGAADKTTFVKQETDLIQPAQDAPSPPKNNNFTESALLRTAAEPVVPIICQRSPFPADVTDTIFALIFSCIGYFYICAIEKLFIFAGRSISASPFEIWAFPVFVCVYAAAVLGYLYARKITPSKESWLWLGVLFALGLPLPVFPPHNSAPAAHSGQ